MDEERRQIVPDDAHYTVQGIHINNLKFDDLEECVTFAIVQGMSQARRGVYDGNIAFLSRLIFASEDTARRRLQTLVEKGYITATERAGKTTLYQAITLEEVRQRNEQPLANCDPSQIATPRSLQGVPLAKTPSTPSTGATPHLKVNIKLKEKENSTHTQEDEFQGYREGAYSDEFLDWWNLYGMTDWRADIEHCWVKWGIMTLAEREQLMRHTEVFAPINLTKANKKRPRWYIDDGEWKNDIRTITGYQQEEINSLQGIEMEYNWKNGIEMVQVIRPDGKYIVITTEDWNKHPEFQFVKKWNKIN